MPTKDKLYEVSNSKVQSIVTIQEINMSIHLKLDGTNYHIRSKVLEMHISERKKKNIL